MVRTAIKRYATALMDLWMAHQELLALEKNQKTSLTIKPMPRPEDHTKQPVMPRPHPLRQHQLTHGQLPRLSFKFKKLLRRMMIRRMMKMMMKFHQTKLKKFPSFRLLPVECTQPTLEENE
jgi:hypothetical protein